MINLVLHFLGLAAAVYLVARLLPGVRLKSFKTALVVSAVYAAVNFALKFVVFKVLFFISYPLLVLSLGVFALLVNTAGLMITDRLIADFELRDGLTAFIAALLLSVSNVVLGILL
ncbi:MAG: phage holin family protein [Deltaproteobacteria bacterium]|nr:phage holin family protein [Deltaproteobacteria bacterium]